MGGSLDDRIRRHCGEQPRIRPGPSRAQPERVRFSGPIPGLIRVPVSARGERPVRIAFGERPSTISPAHARGRWQARAAWAWEGGRLG